MMSLLLRRLAVMKLTDSDQKALQSLEARPIDYPADGVVIDEGDELTRCGLLIDGWALRSKSMPDGRRQVLDVMPPGSVFSLSAVSVGHSDQAVTTLTRAKIGWFSPADLETLFRSSPRAGLAIIWAEACEQSILAERLMSVGRRSAYQRLGHVFIELGRRLKVRGLSDGRCFSLPLTHEVLADLLGMSEVHVSRCLSQLARDGQVHRRRHEDELQLSPEFLNAVDFDPGYLHEQDWRRSPAAGALERSRSQVLQ